MRILAIADEESKALWDYYTPDKLSDVDLIISCGDLDANYLEFLVTMTSCPVLYVPGNHDSAYQERPPEGCENIDGKIYTHNGVRIMGLGGSMKYKNGPYMYTERAMGRRIRRLIPDMIKHRGVDIVVTHAPVKGYGDMVDLPHRGFASLNRLLYALRPVYLLHGHVHASYLSRFKREMVHPSGTILINAYDKYAFEFKESDRKVINRRMLLRNFITG